jgi:hypothetical protein
VLTGGRWPITASAIERTDQSIGGSIDWFRFEAGLPPSIHAGVWLPFDQSSVER